MSMQNYEIIRKLGQGSYGSVYLARQRDSGRQCVMKRMVLRSLNSKERESAFQEARVLRDLSHPNIVAYIDTQATASKLYLFMQFCDGGDLEQRLAKLKETGRAVAQSQALDWFVQMALALQYLHSRRILHRDLKTANVFLTRRDIVKLGDFGVSRVLSATAELARTFVGTPYYLSPELLNNQPYGQPSDVWALGCIFHEIATLEHPYEATTFPSLAFKIINEDVRPLASYPAAQGMEPELQRLVDLMLTKDHTQRATLAQVLNEGVVQRRMLAFVQEAEAAHPRDNPPSTPSRVAAAAAADVAAATTTDAAAAAAAAAAATAASIAPTQRGAPLPARPAQPAPAPALAPRPTCAPAPAPAAPGRPLSRPASASTPAATQAAQAAQAEVPPAAPTPHKRGSNRKAAVAAAAAAGGARGVGARGGYARQAEPRRPEDLRAQIALEQQRLQRMKAPAVTVPPVVPPPPPPPAGAPALQVDAALQAAQAQAETLRSAAAPALAADAAASAAPAASAAADAADAAVVAPCTRSLAQWTECFGDALQPPLAGSAGASAAAPLAKTVGYDEEEDEEYEQDFEADSDATEEGEEGEQGAGEQGAAGGEDGEMEATVRHRGGAGMSGYGGFAACRVTRSTSELSDRSPHERSHERSPGAAPEEAAPEVAALEKTLKQLQLQVADEETRREADGALSGTLLAVAAGLSPTDAHASRWDAYSSQAALA